MAVGVAAPLEWLVRRVARGSGCTEVCHLTVRDVGAAAVEEVEEVAGCCPMVVQAVDQTLSGAVLGTRHEGPGGRNVESGRRSWVEEEVRCGRVGNSNLEESTWDWVANHSPGARSLADVVPDFSHNLPCVAAARMESRSWGCASPRGYSAARERSIRDTCLSGAGYAVAQDRS